MALQEQVTTPPHRKIPGKSHKLTILLVGALMVTVSLIWNDTANADGAKSPDKNFNNQARYENVTEKGIQLSQNARNQTISRGKALYESVSGGNSNGESSEAGPDDPPFSVEDGKLVYHGNEEQLSQDIETFNNTAHSNKDEVLEFLDNNVRNNPNLDRRQKELFLGNLAYRIGNRATDDITHYEDIDKISDDTPEEVREKYHDLIGDIKETNKAHGGQDETAGGTDGLFESNSEDDVKESEEKLKETEEKLKESEEKLKEAEQRLEAAKQELQETLENKQATREELIKAAKDYVENGGNPTDLPDWEWAKENYNISVDDL